MPTKKDGYSRSERCEYNRWYRATHGDRIKKLQSNEKARMRRKLNRMKKKFMADVRTATDRYLKAVFAEFGENGLDSLSDKKTENPS